MRRKSGTRQSQGEGDQEAVRRHMRGLKRYLEMQDAEADVRRAVPRGIEEANDLAIGENSGRRARTVVAGEYARGARRRSAPTSSP